ncbi:LysR family transcriptional regulator [Pseudorhodobacter turbinis]|uniref:LysR family transcriptional regulator n=1 Tax=Pseudorhodobacter turbinis TaxID=2500533 RepID=A0A4P8ECI8_9RHOB|nr:LysR family transcriptional regulator [Pseudorhodobacter turbinis]QCO54417.1 LysR family transcriptional regulator [Pseudorhodobacter turbinis]
MIQINLKLINVFLVAAEQRSFTRAAEITNRSPSAVSMQIKEIEAQIGMALFLRTQQGVVLTPEGQILYDTAHNAIGTVEIGLERLGRIAAARNGNIRLACAPTLAATRLPDILVDFKKRFPNSAVSVIEVSPRASVKFLKDQMVEFYVGPELPDQTDILFEAVAEDPLVAFIPQNFDPGHPVLALKDLCDTPVIMLDKQTAIRSLTEEILAGEAQALNVQYEVHTAQTALALATGGLGIAILPGIAVPTVPPDGMRIVRIDHPRARRWLGIMTLKGSAPHRYSETLMDMVRLDLKRYYKAQ